MQIYKVYIFRIDKQAEIKAQMKCKLHWPQNIGAERTRPNIFVSNYDCGSQQRHKSIHFTHLALWQTHFGTVVLRVRQRLTTLFAPANVGHLAATQNTAPANTTASTGCKSFLFTWPFTPRWFESQISMPPTPCLMTADRSCFKHWITLTRTRHQTSHKPKA